MDAGAGAVLVVMGMAALIAVIGALVEFGRRRHERWLVITAQVTDVKHRRTQTAADPGCTPPDTPGPAAPHTSGGTR